MLDFVNNVLSALGLRKKEVQDLRFRENLVNVPGGTKRLDELQVGDVVESLNPETGETVQNRIEKTEKLPSLPYYVLINGVYPMHQHQSVILSDGNAQHAFKLKVGDKLVDQNGRLVPITKIKKIRSPFPFYKLVIDGDHTFILDGLLVHNASRYWVGGTASWDGTAGTKWASSSGGAGGSSVPTTSDDVFLDANTGAVTITIATGNTGCLSLDCTGFTGTLTGSGALTVAGSFTLVSGMTYTYTGTITFSATSTGKTLTFAGKSSSQNLTFDGVGGEWTLQDAVTTTGTITVTRGSFQSNAQTINAGIFNSDNANTRTVNLTNSTLNLSAYGTFFTLATTTGLTFTGTGSVINSTYSSSGNRVISGGSQALGDINVTGGSGTFTTTNIDCTGLDFTGFVGTLVAAAITIRGDLTFGTGMGVGGSGLAMTVAPPSGTATITCNGVSVERAITVNAPGATVELGDDLTMGTARTFTVTAGTFDVNGFDISCGIFTSSNTNTRTVDVTNATINLANTSGTIFDLSTATNLTFVGTGSTINATANTASTRIIHGGAQTLGAINVQAGTSTVTLSSVDCTSLNFTGFSGSYGKGAITVRGNVTFATGMAFSGTADTMTISPPSGTAVLTCNGCTVNRPIEIDAAGAGVILGDDLALGSTRALTITAGSFDTDDFDVDVANFSSTNANTRSIDFGSSVITLRLASGTPFNFTTVTGLTFNAGTSMIIFEGASASTRTFAGGGKTFYDVWFNTLTGAGQITNTGSNTFHSLKDDGTVAHSVIFTTGGTTTITSGDGWQIEGTAGQLIILDSVSGGTNFTISIASGIVNTNYLDIRNSDATGGALFYAGPNSVNTGPDNTGWVFTAAEMAKTKGLIYSVKTVPAAKTKSLQYVVTGGATEVVINKGLIYDVKLPVALTKSLKYTVTTEASALTKSLKYTVTVEVAALTKGLIYRVKTVPAAKTKALAYDVKTDSTVQKSLRYAVVVDAPVTKGLIYVVERPIAITKSLAYKVTVEAAITKSLKYTVLGDVALTKALTYRVAKPTAITKSLAYDVAGSVEVVITKSITYRVTVLPYRVNPVSPYQNRATPYHVYSR